MSDFFYISLATYGISTLLSDYSGPKDIFNHLRQRGLPDCAVCICPWVSGLLCIVYEMSIIEYLAITGIVILIIRIEDAI